MRLFTATGTTQLNRCDTHSVQVMFANLLSPRKRWKGVRKPFAGLGNPAMMRPVGVSRSNCEAAVRGRSLVSSLPEPLAMTMGVTWPLMDAMSVSKSDAPRLNNRQFARQLGQ
jgi:hypothetical protein